MKETETNNFSERREETQEEEYETFSVDGLYKELDSMYGFSNNWEYIGGWSDAEKVNFRVRVHVAMGDYEIGMFRRTYLNDIVIYPETDSSFIVEFRVSRDRLRIWGMKCVNNE